MKTLVDKSKIDPQDYKNIYSKILPKIKRHLLRNRKDNFIKTNKTTDKTKLLGTPLEEALEQVEKKEEIKQPTYPNLKSKENQIKEEFAPEDYIKILEIFNNSEFIEMTKNKSLIECLILTLKLGYIDGKYFSSTAIANFLDIEVEFVNKITKNTMLEYKEKLNQMIDQALENEGLENKPFIKLLK